MGTWLGHAAPGTFFIAFSLWWLIRSVHSYYSSQGRGYRNSLIKFCCCKHGCCSRLPVDNYILLFLSALGVIMEIATSVANTGELVMGNQEHLTMYIGFGLAGLIAILVHHKIKFIPEGAEYMTLIVALLMELVLFLFHLHGREIVDKHVHMLLVYTIGGCAVAVAIEHHYPRSINAALARTYFFMLQGTWFYQIAFTLYPPDGMNKWNITDPENEMLLTLIYSWHMIGCLMVMLILSGLTYWCCSPKCRGEYNSDEMNLLPVSSHRGKEYCDNEPPDSGHSSAMMKGYNSVASDEDEHNP